MSINKLVAGTKGDAGNSNGADIANSVNGLIDSDSRVKSTRVSRQPQIPLVVFGAGGNTGSSISPRIWQYPAINDTEATPLSDSAFEYSGVKSDSLDIASGDSVVGKLFTGASASSATGRWLQKISFDFTGTECEIQFRASISGSAKYKLYINGEPLTYEMQESTVVSGSPYKIYLTFSDGKPKNISVVFLRLNFSGVIVPSDYRVVKPSLYGNKKVVVLSNSICAGYGYDTFRWGTWPALLSDDLGYDLYNISVGGTGYIAEPTYETRLPDISGIDPDVIIFGDHYNDLGETEEDIKVAIDSLITSLKTNHPNAELVILGGWLVDENLSEKQKNIDTYVRTVAEQNGIKLLMYSNPTNNWGIVDDWETATAYKQGRQVRYGGMVWECFADHTSSGAEINTSGFRPSLIVTSNTNSDRMLADGIHPKDSTSAMFAASFARLMQDT